MISRHFEPDWLSKPGETLAALATHQEITPEHLADRLKLKIGEVRQLLAGVLRIDEELSVRLAKRVGGTPAFWEKRQAVYDAALSRFSEELPKDVAKAWLQKFPRKEMSDFGWVPKPSEYPDLIKAYLSYFGVSGPEEWEKRYASFLTDIAYRKSPAFESKLGALSAWLRQGEIEASMVPTARWDWEILRSALPELRKLSRKNSPAKFLPEVRKICASAGVAVVFVRAPSGCPVSGATRFLTDTKAMVILSFRYLSDDHFWFTFFHELGHLILHSKSSTFVDANSISGDSREAEANTFAANVIVPMERQSELIELKARTEKIIPFAKSVGVSPGLIVGQMQHLQLIGNHQLNFLKRRFTWDEISSVFN